MEFFLGFWLGMCFMLIFCIIATAIENRPSIGPMYCKMSLQEFSQDLSCNLEKWDYGFSYPIRLFEGYWVPVSIEGHKTQKAKRLIKKKKQQKMKQEQIELKNKILEKN